MLPEKNNSAINMGILIGESHLLSVLPEYSQKLDLLLILDINPLLHKHIQYLCDTLKESHLHNFIFNYSKKIATCFTKKYKTDNFQELFNELKSLTGTHFFLNPSRFSACKKALTKIEIVHLCANLFNTEHINAIAKVIKKNEANLCLINITNLKECAENEKKKNLQINIDNLAASSKQKPYILFSGFLHEIFPKKSSYPTEITDKTNLESMHIKQNHTSTKDKFLSGQRIDDKKKLVEFLIDHIFNGRN